MPSSELIVETAEAGQRTLAGIAGEFILDNVPVGSYTLLFIAPSENGQLQIEGCLTNVEVENNNVTDLGEIFVEEIAPVAHGG